MFKSITSSTGTSKMSATPRTNEDLLGESWIELSSNTNTCPKSPDRTTPLPFTSVEEYLRLLREAQRESKESSRVASLTSSRRESTRGSPKSPPNSPNTELATTEEELKGVYINYLNREGDATAQKDNDWVWEWSSRPEQLQAKYVYHHKNLLHILKSMLHISENGSLKTLSKASVALNRATR